jgi:UDP-N-acetylglucosamine 4,6-dehydratase
MVNIFRGKNILVTGGTGSIGSEIVKEVLQYEPEVVRILSNDENALFNLEQELHSHSSARFLVGDVRDRERLRKAVEGIDFIFHAAALKHVPLCEYNPFEAVKTNVLGTQNIIEVAMEEEIEKLVTISTDKAVNPINVMGATKLLAERLTISANYYSGARRTTFCCVRFGNVLDSRGSVVPLFRDQIHKGGPVTITDQNMTRFVMSVPRAVSLVLRAAQKSKGGEIFILKMPALHIKDLAEVMIEELARRYGYVAENIKTKVVGKRPGEKSYEELLTADEAVNAVEIEDMFIISLTTGDWRSKGTPTKAYTSKDEKPLSKKAISELLRENLVL